MHIQSIEAQQPSFETPSSDRSTIKLMNRFDRELSTPGVSKALALHRAQQELLDDPKYQAPYYWSPYVLVGNWR